MELPSFLDNEWFVACQPEEMVFIAPELLSIQHQGGAGQCFAVAREIMKKLQELCLGLSHDLGRFIVNCAK